MDNKAIQRNLSRNMLSTTGFDLWISWGLGNVLCDTFSSACVVSSSEVTTNSEIYRIHRDLVLTVLLEALKLHMLQVLLVKVLRLVGRLIVHVDIGTLHIRQTFKLHLQLFRYIMGLEE